MVYDPDIAGSLAKLLSIVLRRSSAEVLPQVFICSTIRNLETYGGFKQQLGKTEEEEEEEAVVKMVQINSDLNLIRVWFT